LTALILPPKGYTKYKRKEADLSASF